VGVAREAGDVTVLRIVGDLVFHSWASGVPGGGQADFLVHWHLGVLFADVDPNTGATLEPAQNPGTAYDAETKDWLWRYHTAHQLLTSVDGSSDPIAGMAGADERAHLDITVKRKLRRDEGLWLQIICLFETVFTNGAAGTASLCRNRLTSNVRCLVALP